MKPKPKIKKIQTTKKFILFNNIDYYHNSNE